MPNDISPEIQPVERMIEQSPGPRMTAFRAGAPVSAIVPRTLGELAMVASAILRAGMAPDSYTIAPEMPETEETRVEAADKTKSRIMIGIMKGAEVGLPPIAAVSTIAIINNRPCIWGDGAMALVQSRGVIERVEETFEGEERTAAAVEVELGNVDYAPTSRDFRDDFAAVCRIWRRGQSEPYVGRFSVRDARRAKLWNNPKKLPWIEHPKRMLTMRARAYPLRDGFADCLMGLGICEEVEDLPVETPKTDISFLDDAPAQPALPAPSEPPVAGLQPLLKTPADMALVSTGHGDNEFVVANGNLVACDADCWLPDLPTVTAEQVYEAERRAPADVPMPVVPDPRPVGSPPTGKEERTLIGGAEATPARATAAVEDERTTATIPIIDVVKPPGRNAKPDWRAIREKLVEAFKRSATVADCDGFRLQHAGTIDLLRSGAKDEFSVFDSVCAALERSLSKAAKKSNVVSQPV
jgi:hypothetical protein